MAKRKYTREERHALAKEANIHFSLEITSNMECKKIFKQIKDIGNIRLDKYHAEIRPDSQDEPWRKEVKQRAKWIKKKVNRCYKDRATEFGWRLAVENAIFSRFEVEVICRQCRRRIWEADWKMALQSNELAPGESVKSLIGQEDCKCKKRHRDDRYSPGPSQMFGYSAESMVQYEENEIREVHQNQRPDGMYWLYRAGRIEELLKAESTTRGKKVGDIVQSRPSGSSVANMAFPFLLFEAKSASSADNFDDINLQSCFAIREMLKIQHDLFFNREDRKYEEARPFVWFISSHGHMWYVSGAYFCGRSQTTQIVHLWSGSIAETEQALRLLLIIDYICDWARKVYRANVIEQLLNITHDPTPSLRAETRSFSISDTCSWGQRVGDYVLGRDQELEENYLRPSKNEITITQVLELLDSQDMAIRDARYRHFRVCALQINTDNIEDFFLYERNHEAAQARAKALMKCLKAPHAWRVKIGALKALEKSWVGCHIDQIEPGDKEESFLTRFGIQSYIECRPPSRADKKLRPGNWLQVHELTFIAISEGAIADLAKRSGYKTERYKIQLQDCPKASESGLVRYFEQIKSAPVRDCITAAMQQRSVVSISVEGRQLSGDLEADHCCYAPGMDVCCDNDDLYVIQAPRSTYNRHRIGRKEPSETFTWKSPKQLGSSGPKVSPIQHIEYPVLHSYVPEEDDAVLVTNEAGSCCVFLVKSKASRTISISQAYSISTLAAGGVLKQSSLTEPRERDISSLKARMLSFLGNIIDFVGPSPDRRRSSTLQLQLSSFQEKIASYIDEDASTAEDYTVQTLIKSFEQKTREYGIKKMLRCMMVAFEEMLDNEDLEHNAVLSELDGNDSTDEDESTEDEYTEDESTEYEYTEDESTEDDDVGTEAASGIGSDDSENTFGAGQNGKGSADEPHNGFGEIGKRALPHRFYKPNPKPPRKGKQRGDQ